MSELDEFKGYLYGFADLVAATVEQDRKIIDQFVKSQQELLSIIASLIYKFEENGEVYLSPEHINEYKDKFFKLKTDRDADGGMHYKVDFEEEPKDGVEPDSREDI